MLLKIVMLLLVGQTLIPADPIAAASDFVAKIVETLPAWEKDKLAQFEQPELAAVRRDLVIVLSDVLEDDVLQDIARLNRDWKTLVALDNKLKFEDVI